MNCGKYVFHIRVRAGTRKPIFARHGTLLRQRVNIGTRSDCSWRWRTSSGSSPNRDPSNPIGSAVAAQPKTGIGITGTGIITLLKTIVKSEPRKTTIVTSTSVLGIVRINLPKIKIWTRPACDRRSLRLAPCQRQEAHEILGCRHLLP